MTGFPIALQRRLLDVQALDSKVDALNAQWQKHPAVAVLQDLTGRAQDLARQIGETEKNLADVTAQVRAAEREAEQIRSHQARDRRRLDAGQVSSPRELESLQHQIATLQEKLDEVETTELEAMEAQDAAESEAARVRSEAEAVDRSRQEAEHELDQARAAIATERDSLAAERAAIVADLPDGLVARYDRSRAQYGGVGVGALRHGRCEGCRLALTPADMARVSAAAEDALLRCEECGRLLVRVEDA